jgi:hypothetical protein
MWYLLKVCSRRAHPSDAADLLNVMYVKWECPSSAHFSARYIRVVVFPVPAAAVMRTSFEDEALGGSAVARMSSCSGDNRMDDMGKKGARTQQGRRTHSLCLHFLALMGRWMRMFVFKFLFFLNVIHHQSPASQRAENFDGKNV